MSNNSDLLEHFDVLPALSPEILAKDVFQFPRLEAKHRKFPAGGTSHADVTEATTTSDDSARGPIEQLLNALTHATRKLEYSKTPLTEWNSSMVFSETSVTRDSKSKRFQLNPGQTETWNAGDPINLSRQVANDWFRSCLVHRIKSGGDDRHAHVILGAQGCGKSTLIKYLMSNNSSYVTQRKLVFTRFEFLKFWKRWYPNSPTLDEALTDYISFIHARDLVLDRFFDFLEGDQFALKFPFRNASTLVNELETLAREVRRLSGDISGLETESSEDAQDLVEQAFERAQKGNTSLMNWLKGLSVHRRILLVGALWDDRTIVTIFDGLDTLRVEDAFQGSDEWEAVCHIISQRKALSSPTVLRTLGIAHDNDSIVVMRKNTAKLLEYERNQDISDLGLQNYYYIDEIDGLSAIVSTISRAVRNLPNSQRHSEHEIDVLVFEMGKIIQRTMLAIGRGHGASVPAQLLYNFFDGNLRELFSFIALIFDRSVKEMLPGGFLDSKDYFGEPEQLIRALASEKGNEFLRKKNYRVIELLMRSPDETFENAAGIVSSKSKLLRSRNPEKRITGNPDHSGYIDNIFSYLTPEALDGLDSHGLLEKVRIVQLLSEESLTETELGERLKNTFGYVPNDFEFLLRLLLKTDFISGEITRNELEYDVELRATSRGEFCIRSLLLNLAYLENVFHKTQLPKALIDHINDKPRDDGPVKWAAVSIRNAFILLSYFSCLENNSASGVPVPDKYRLVEGVKEKVVVSIERMTRIHGNQARPYPQDDRERHDASRIVTLALAEINATLAQWKSKGVLQ